MSQEKESKSLDLLGIKPIASAIDKTVEKSLDGVTSFLSLVCAPALGELGMLLQDRVRYWRLNNVVKMLEKAKGKLEYKDQNLQVKSHPRVAISIIENSSYIEDGVIQEMWAGLFASSCTEEEQDDGNLIFVDLLKKLTSAQARILNYSIENCRKILHKNDLVTADAIIVKVDKLEEVTSISNIHRIDRELDYLKSLGLIGSNLSGGFELNLNNSELVANITPTYLALSLYVKTRGSTLNPPKFYKDNIITQEQINIEMENERLKIKKENDLIKENKKEN